MTWTPTCEALPPVGAQCVGIYHAPDAKEPEIVIVRYDGDGVWKYSEPPSWMGAYPPRMWALLPAVPEAWTDPCPIGGLPVDHQDTPCSCGRVGGVAP